MQFRRIVNSRRSQVLSYPPSFRPFFRRPRLLQYALETKIPSFCVELEFEPSGKMSAAFLSYTPGLQKSVLAWQWLSTVVCSNVLKLPERVMHNLEDAILNVLCCFYPAGDAKHRNVLKNWFPHTLWQSILAYSGPLWIPKAFGKSHFGSLTFE